MLTRHPQVSKKSNVKPSFLGFTPTQYLVTLEHAFSFIYCILERFQKKATKSELFYLLVSWSYLQISVEDLSIHL